MTWVSNFSVASQTHSQIHSYICFRRRHVENEENLDQIKYQMNTIDYLPREVLKYLLKHLIR